MLQEYSSSDSEIQITEKQNWEFYIEGRINVKDNEIELLELDSDIVPSQWPKLKKIKIDDGKIYADCENLSDNLFGKRPFGNWNCKNKTIKFSRIEE